MGINGLYQELAPGEGVALSRLSLEHFERTGRPLRIAIDGPIWQFQIQAAKGGLNPALRALYFRLLRLVKLNIQAIFVFDGPNKPPTKRDKPTQPHAVTAQDVQVKNLLDLFGFPHWNAPGEAEAECALFQRKGLVDIVLSEDIDALMFGCTRMIREWSNETRTHVKLYERISLKADGGQLDREEMIMIAMMSGADYAPGITGCGIKTACEVATAGFGKELCAIMMDDMVGLDEWREKLNRELHTNESGYFQRTHKSVKIPHNFPDATILGYYVTPMVSAPEHLNNLTESVSWDVNINVVALGKFVGEAFGWHHLSGTRKLIRGLAPALLTHRLRVRGEAGWSVDDNDSNTAIDQEAQLVESICGRRTHASTDFTPELRLSYTPATIVGLDPELEEAGDNLGKDADLLQESSSELVDDSGSQSHSKPGTPGAPQEYDPTRPDRIWVLESFVKIGIPLTFKKWEDQTQKVGGMRKGALDAYMKPMGRGGAMN